MDIRENNLTPRNAFMKHVYQPGLINGNFSVSGGYVPTYIEVYENLDSIFRLLSLPLPLQSPPLTLFKVMCF